MRQIHCPRRRWGKTELSIPVITLGGDGFGNKFGRVTDDEAFALLKRAIELGVNHKEGLLTGRPVETFKPKSEWKPQHHRAETIRLWCKEHDIDLLTLALQFCLRNPHIHGLSIGCKNIAELEQNVAAILTPLPDNAFDHFHEANL